ncbi:MAG: hypothetical protein RBT61_13370 [Candidatus Kapabacteria bacterium]|jgi:hypothetical protein|nr:hypothetical protein [Candidatus Kapabacteria bacterium]
MAIASLVAGAVLNGTANGENDALGGLSGNLLSGITGAVSNFFSSTIGSIFANGFDLSCWGSSANPADEKSYASDRMQFFLTKSGIASVVNQTTVNEFMKLTDVVKSVHHKIGIGNYASCTKKAHQFSYQAITQFQDSILQSMQSNGVVLESTGEKQGTLNLAHNEYPHWGNTFKATDTYRTFKVSASSNASNSGGENDDIDNPDNGGSGSFLKTALTTVGLGILVNAISK